MEIKVELNIPADLEIELSSTFLVEPSRQFGVEHSYTEFLELSNCSHPIPLLVPNVVIGTESVVTHALPNLSEEKKEEEKRGGKEGKFAFFLWAS